MGWGAFLHFTGLHLTLPKLKKKNRMHTEINIASQGVRHSASALQGTPDGEVTLLPLPGGTRMHGADSDACWPTSTQGCPCSKLHPFQLHYSLGSFFPSPASS